MQNPSWNGIMTSLKLCWIGQIQLQIKLFTRRATFLLNALLKATLKEHNKETNTSLASEGGDLKPVSLLQSSAPCRVEQFCNVWREILDIYQGRCKGDPWHFRNEHTLSKQRFQRGQDRMLSLLWNIQLLKETVFLIDFHQLHSAYRSNFEHKGYFRSHN